MHKTRDACHASNGWSMIWNLDVEPQYIKYYNREGILESDITGQLDMAYVLRKLKQFQRVHDWTQPTLFTLEQAL